MELSEKAYAKINLHLAVLHKRADGYHQINSLNASVGIFDLLKLENLKIHAGSQGPVHIMIKAEKGRYDEIADAIPVADNLITRAARAYLGHAGSSAEMTVTLAKNIPSGGGLGGGSSDAAAMLRLLNRRLGLFNEDELVQLAAGIGADVPYCLGGGFALCEGIGERIRRIGGLLPYQVLIVNDGIHINTADAYRALNRTGDPIYDQEKSVRIRERLDRGVVPEVFRDIIPLLHNDFEPVMMEQFPRLREIRDLINGFSPEFCMMTGSGSTIVALFEDGQRAHQAEQGLQNIVKDVFLTQFVY